MGTQKINEQNENFDLNLLKTATTTNKKTNLEKESTKKTRELDLKAIDKEEWYSFGGNTKSKKGF